MTELYSKGRAEGLCSVCFSCQPACLLSESCTGFCRWRAEGSYSVFDSFFQVIADFMPARRVLPREGRGLVLSSWLFAFADVRIVLYRGRTEGSCTCAASICTTDSDYPGVFLNDEGAKKIISFVCVFSFLLFINRQENQLLT